MQFPIILITFGRNINNKAMNTLKVPKIIPATASAEELKEIFSTLESNIISNCNWPEDFPYTPEASFKLFHDGANIYLQFEVNEKDLHAKITEDFGEVWTDPCVEMFISPDSDTYYNFECTCIGKMLVACHAKDKETERMPLDTLSAIKRIPSLGTDNFELREGDNTWSIIEIIPASSLFNHSIGSWDGKKMRANFYKCGDNLPNPHFLSWNRIDFHRPNFHLPEFFAEIQFE